MLLLLIVPVMYIFFRLEFHCLPGVFAVGDVRGDSIKRIASTVGEGSTAISFDHQVPQEWKIDQALP